MGKQCICGNRRAFANCCEPYLVGTIKGDTFAPTAEALMRSRYTAFVLGNIDYLLATHHADYRPGDHTSLQTTIQTTQWVNLIILSRQKGQKKDKTGSVEFVAAYRPKAHTSSAAPSVALPSAASNRHKALLGVSAGVSAVISTGVSDKSTLGSLSQLHERSQFVREGGQWFYTKGAPLPPYQPKRNQPCWCGSQLQFRQCHGS